MDGNYEIRKLKDDEIQTALALVWEVFLQFESPVYPKEGTQEFYNALHDKEYLSGLEYYGAFDEETMVGVVGIRKAKKHICFFFVKGDHHRRGIGTALFDKLLEDYNGLDITVNSSPFGVPFYKSIGFVPTSEEQTINGISFTPMIRRN